MIGPLVVEQLEGFVAKPWRIAFIANAGVTDSVLVKYLGATMSCGSGSCASLSRRGAEESNARVRRTACWRRLVMVGELPEKMIAAEGGCKSAQRR